MKYFFKQILKISAFYLEKQKSLFLKKYNLSRSLEIGQESSSRWRLLSQFSVKVLELDSKSQDGKLQMRSYKSLECSRC